MIWRGEAGDVVFALHGQFDTGAFNYQATVSATAPTGEGDSSTLVNPLVTRDYTSLGPITHFEAGLAFPLLRAISFDTTAYEQLPLGNQKIYSQVKRRGRTTPVVMGRSVIEDYGFISSLDLPIDGHTTLSAYYNRSLRLKDDVVSLGITYVLRGIGEKECRPDCDSTTVR